MNTTKCVIMALTISVLTGCGQAMRNGLPAGSLALSGALDGSTATTGLPVEMDAIACPADMFAVPAVLGHAAFCMDTGTNVSKGQQAAATDCLAVGKTLCSGAQYFQAKDLGVLAAVHYMASDTVTAGGTAQAYRFNIDGVNGGFLANSTYVSKCCSR